MQAHGGATRPAAAAQQPRPVGQAAGSVRGPVRS